MKGLPAATRAQALVAAGLVIVALLVGWAPAAFNADYVHDDHPAVLNNVNVTWPPPVQQIFSSPYFGPGPKFSHQGLARPLVTLSFAAEAGLGLDSAAARHGVNLLLYAVICLLVALLIYRIASIWQGLSQTAAVGWAGLSAVIFACHPIHASSVMAVAYRPELMALLFVLAASLLWLQLLEGAPRPWLRGAVGAGLFGLALLSKESAICALAPWGLAAWMRRRGLRQCLPMAVPAIVLAAALLLWRRQAMGGVLVAAIPWADNPLATVDPWTRLIGAMEGVWLAMGHLLLPLSVLQAPDWTFDALPVAQGLTACATAGLCVTLLAGGIAIRGLLPGQRAGRGGLLALGLIWSAAFYLPVANVLFPIPIRFAERLLFSPSLTACVLLAWPAVTLQQRARLGWQGWCVERAPRLKSWPMATLGTGLLIGAGLLSQAVPLANHWGDEERLFRWGVEQQPRSAKMRFNLGRLLVARKREAEAMDHLKLAVALRPDDWDAKITLLEAHFRLGRCAQSRTLVETMEATQPKPRMAHVALYFWSQACAEPDRMRRHEPWMRGRPRGPREKPHK